MRTKARHLTSTIILGLTLAIITFIMLTIVTAQYQDCKSDLKFYSLNDPNIPTCSIFSSTISNLIFVIILFEIFIFILNIMAFWKSNLSSRLIKISDVLNIMIGLASMGWAIFILVRIKSNAEAGLGMLLEAYVPFLLLIPSILFLIGYFKKKLTQFLHHIKSF